MVLVKLSLYDAESHGLNLMELRPGTCTCACMHALEQLCLCVCRTGFVCLFVCLGAQRHMLLLGGWVRAYMWCMLRAPAGGQGVCVVYCACVCVCVRACACVCVGMLNGGSAPYCIWSNQLIALSGLLNLTLHCRECVCPCSNTAVL